MQLRYNNVRMSWVVCPNVWSRALLLRDIWRVVVHESEPTSSCPWLQRVVSRAGRLPHVSITVQQPGGIGLSLLEADGILILPRPRAWADGGNSRDI